MQKFICTANLTKNPELRETTNGKKVATLGIAINRDYGDGTDFFNVNVWGVQAENCAKYLTKGSKVCIVGTVQNRSYDGKDGVKRTVTEINADNVEFLSPKKERPTLTEIVGDDLPF